jgi:solute carrier family 35, member E1
MLFLPSFRFALFNDKRKQPRQLPKYRRLQNDGYWLYRYRFLPLPAAMLPVVQVCALLISSSSAITNNLAKEIMVEYKWPLTLTLIQFGFVSLFCFIYTKLSSGEIRRPTYGIVKATLPLGLFQIVGHFFSSMALTFVSVSFSHTIKALSPLFTVLIYTNIYHIAYSRSVYVSLGTLTLGVIMVCATNLQFHLIGFFCSLGSTFTFVMYNLF